MTTADNKFKTLRAAGLTGSNNDMENAFWNGLAPVYDVDENGNAVGLVGPDGAVVKIADTSYTLQAGGLIKSKERAPVGATCDTSKPTKPSGKDVYASFNSTSLVALCSKQ